MTYILNYRYTQKKITLLTSNLPETKEEARKQNPEGKDRWRDTLTDRIGVRVRSRLYEICDLVRIEADDFRLTIQSHPR